MNKLDAHSVGTCKSTDLLQRLGRLGIDTGRFSADQTKPNDPMAAYVTLGAAIAYQLIHNVQAFRHVGQIQGASNAAAVAAPKLGGQVTVAPYNGFASAMEEIRFLRGMPNR